MLSQFQRSFALEGIRDVMRASCHIFLWFLLIFRTQLNHTSPRALALLWTPSGLLCTTHMVLTYILPNTESISLWKWPVSPKNLETPEENDYNWDFSVFPWDLASWEGYLSNDLVVSQCGEAPLRESQALGELCLLSLHTHLSRLSRL